jgi:hypothetical protein
MAQKIISFTKKDSKLLQDCKVVIKSEIDVLVDWFYQLKTSIAKPDTVTTDKE